MTTFDCRLSLAASHCSCRYRAVRFVGATSAELPEGEPEAFPAPVVVAAVAPFVGFVAALLGDSVAATEREPLDATRPVSCPDYADLVGA